MTEKSGLYGKIVKVSEAIGALAADKKNTDQGYDYISADKVLERAGKAMANAGLVVIPAIACEATETVTYKSYNKEKTRYDCVVEFDMTIADVEGESITQRWVSRGVDYASPDKALFKAITSGHKYFLMKLFNVGIGNEDGEHQLPPTDKQKRSNGSKPFYASAAKKIKYYKHGKHVKNAMKGLGLAYPSTGQDATKALALLNQYADLRADGVEQDEAKAIVTGGMGQPDDAETETEAA